MLSLQRPLRVAVLCSQRAPGLLYLLNRSPERGVAFDIACAITSERTFAEEVVVERRGIPTRPHSIADFYHARGASALRDASVRADYDRQTVKMLAPFMPDLVVLDGYRYLVTAPLLETFANRIVNLHFSDLTIRTRRGGPRYPGIRAVRDAIADGCDETRATVHLVNEEPDAGTPIVRSWPFPVSPMAGELRSLSVRDGFKAYVFAHEQWMMRTVAGPLLGAALRLVATGGVDLDHLATAHPRYSAPWLLEPQGFLMASDLEFA